MLVLAVTHPDTGNRSPRSLSEGGRQQALLMARRLRELVGKHVVIGTVISSPKARCLETAILIAREMGETTKEDGGYDRIVVKTELEERPGIANDYQILKTILDEYSQGTSIEAKRALLLSVHGDLANMLSNSTKFRPEFASGGWFDMRPIVIVFDYSDSAINMKSCEGLSGGSWITCLS